MCGRAFRKYKNMVSRNTSGFLYGINLKVKQQKIGFENMKCAVRGF